MASLPFKLIVACCALALALAAAPANAKTKKHKKPVQAAAAVKTGYRGTNLFPAGPIYNGNDYLGDDPDPNIRFQIQRDLGVHYGGEP